MDDAELHHRADQLARTTADLSDSINALVGRLDQVDDQARRSRRLAWYTAFGLVLDVLLTVVVVLVFSRERQLTNTQETVNRDVLCPLYGVLLGSYDQTRRDALPPAQQTKYDNAFAVLRQGAQTLGCN